MIVFLAALGIIVFSGFAALAARSQKSAVAISAVGVVFGSIAGLFPAFNVLLTGQNVAASWPWAVPWGSFSLEIDAVSAIFLVPVFIVSAVAAIYGIDYMLGYKDKNVGPSCLFYNLLIAGMAMVITARNGVLFLVCWEIMSLASYFLVTFENEQEEVRQAGWTYLVATHIGTAFLLAFFAILGREAGSLDFNQFAALKSMSPALASMLFALSLVGFGTKAGIMPLHIWLPEAHPAAPSHVSAVMSAVMIKTGIYGIIRTLMLLPAGPAWWGYLLIGIGAVSGILAILLALAQHDFKRFLAYSSVENVGIIIMALGLGVLGKTIGSDALCVLGFAAAFLHILNHAMFKGLLFMCAGSILHAVHTRQMDKLGGLIKQMPWTGAMFAIGSVAICGLPPLNGFIGEFLLYLGAYKGCIFNGLGSLVPSITIICSLALIGGFAVAGLTKVFGTIFLGESRTQSTLNAHEAGPSMRFAMLIPAGACLVLGLGAPYIIGSLRFAIMQAAGVEDSVSTGQLYSAALISKKIIIVSLALMVLIIAVWAFRNRLLRNRIVKTAPTWDCAYARPNARIQYTASSFTQPITEMATMILRTKRKNVQFDSMLPKEQDFETSTPEPGKQYLFGPLFRMSDFAMDKMRFLQQGSVQLYVLYIAVTLILLLLWKL